MSFCLFITAVSFKKCVSFHFGDQQKSSNLMLLVTSVFNEWQKVAISKWKRDVSSTCVMSLYVLPAKVFSCIRYSKLLICTHRPTSHTICETPCYPSSITHKDFFLTCLETNSQQTIQHCADSLHLWSFHESSSWPWHQHQLGNSYKAILSNSQITTSKMNIDCKIYKRFWTSHTPPAEPSAPSIVFS